MHLSLFCFVAFFHLRRVKERDVKAPLQPQLPCLLLFLTLIMKPTHSSLLSPPLMAPTTRKLFPDHPPSSYADPPPDPCATHCDPTQNTLGFCPLPCLPLCPSLCHPFAGFFPPSQSPAQLSVNTSSSHQHDHLSALLIPMIVLLASGILLSISYFVYSTLSSSPTRLQRPRRLPEVDHSIEVLNYHPVWYIRTAGLQPSVINSITVCEYKKGDGLVQGTACSVCLAEFQDGDRLRLLPKCCHAFHVTCIDTWLATRTTCPVCRALVIHQVDDSEGGEARLVEIVGGSRSGGEVSGENAVEPNGDTGEEGEMGWPIRRAASMNSLCVEFGRKLNSSFEATNSCNSLAARSLSCTGKLFSSGRNGLQ